MFKSLTIVCLGVLLGLAEAVAFGAMHDTATPSGVQVQAMSARRFSANSVSPGYQARSFYAPAPRSNNYAPYSGSRSQYYGPSAQYRNLPFYMRADRRILGQLP
jgi:hypothetical protein